MQVNKNHMMTMTILNFSATGITLVFTPLIYRVQSDCFITAKPLYYDNDSLEETALPQMVALNLSKITDNSVKIPLNIHSISPKLLNIRIILPWKWV